MAVLMCLPKTGPAIAKRLTLSPPPGEARRDRILRETDQSLVAEVTKAHDVSGETIYQWRRKFAGIDVTTPIG
jgi:hypothetical protein